MQAPMFRPAALAGFLFLSLAASHAEPAAPAALAAFPDYLAVRSEFLSAVITAPSATALSFKPAFRETPAGTVRVSVERSGTAFYVMFQRQRDGGYPLSSRGNIIIKREQATGYLTQIKWILSDDGLSWVALSPRNERTILDYVVAGSVVRSELSLPVILYYFIMNPFTYLHDAARSGIDWSLALGAPGPAAAEAFASGLSAPSPHKAEAAFLKAVADLGQAGKYLGAIGAPSAKAEEAVAPAFARVAGQPDEHESGPFAAAPAWDRDRGLALSSAYGTVLSLSATAARSGTPVAFVGLVDGGDEKPPLKLALVAWWRADGSPALRAWDAEARSELDWVQLVRSRPEARIRLFSLPLPGA